MFNGVQSGRVGAIVGFKRNNTLEPQGIRPFVQPSNPKTTAQSIQRAKFAGAAKLASILSQISDHNIEGKKIGNINRAEYVRMLLGVPMVAAKGGISAAVDSSASANSFNGIDTLIPLSKGSLGAFQFTDGETDGEVTQDVLDFYGLKVGDIVTALQFTYADSSNRYITGVRYWQCEISLGPVSAENFLALDYNDQQAGIITIDTSKLSGYVQADGNVAAIIERMDGNRHLLSSSYINQARISLSQSTEIYETFQNSDAAGYRNMFLYGSELFPDGTMRVPVRAIYANGDAVSGVTVTQSPNPVTIGSNVTLQALLPAQHEVVRWQKAGTTASLGGGSSLTIQATEGLEIELVLSRYDG